MITYGIVEYDVEWGVYASLDFGFMMLGLESIVLYGRLFTRIA